MDQFAALTGRQYHLFDYVGAPDAERVIVMMGSGAESRAGDGRRSDRRAARRSACSRSACSGRSRSSTSCERCRRRSKPIAVLDRTKEPGATGEPLYLDVVTALVRELRPTAACRRSSAAATASSPRNSRRRWSRASSTSCAKPQPKNHFTDRHQRRRDAHQPDFDPTFSTSSPTARCARCSTAWARTARSAPTRTRSRSSAKRPTTTRRATSSTTRRSPARVTISHLRFGPSRSAPAT